MNETHLPTEDHSTPKTFWLLGTPLTATSYEDFTQYCHRLIPLTDGQPRSIDFTNTHIVVARRHEKDFKDLTKEVDFFVPDGMPLIWCLNARGAGLKDRVYGPSFMKYGVLNSPAPWTHYFLGGSEECVNRLKENFERWNPQVKIVGVRNGYFKEKDEPAILEEINRLKPDFLWVGLGTPKQQAWIQRYKPLIQRGLILAVGFAFDVNAGTKPDAPAWMQRKGLTWLYRLASEPRRLLARYGKYNSLFLWYLLWDGIRGKAFRTFPRDYPGNSREESSGFHSS